MNNAVDKVKLNEIPGILEKIKNEIDSAHLVTNSLQNLINPILEEEHPSSDKTNEAVPPPSTSLGKHLDSLYYDILSLRLKIADMGNRVQL